MIRQSFDLEIFKTPRSLGASQCQFWPHIVEHEHPIAKESIINDIFINYHHK